ncbi:ecto-NOX disulfide-thiol exchanger 1 isoform X4 [Canis lupus baileyi]|uniref:ecto-NOX disulfide-thiol exchanger 1 isoform X4 n=1 Tax=Canis lupus familiaris TaxID=9615 RepID=UPI000BAA213A|nr:ecto-NOX disulfide-thiol exchanger 1 isoform X4 [Canis lupus familiaris]|eukprot:XP_022264048.1 ecto-NOX disulfide-thiol exchanger 1 isoform X4 [Canis lupus familiaris]
MGSRKRGTQHRREAQGFRKMVLKRSPRTTESDDLRGDPALSHQSAPAPQDAPNSGVDAGGVESISRCPQQLPPMMAAAADGLGSIAIDTTQLNMSVTDPTAWATAMNNLGMVPVGLPGQQLVSDSICVPGFDPGLNMMTGITPINPMIPGLGLVPPPPPTEVAVVKEIIHCKSCTLFPQNPNLPPPSTRERPPGCKTVFVGGLPENATEEIIQEVFEQCGDITAIRKSKKNFCHIRFAEEFMVDKAIYLSGYRMRLGSSTDKKDSGRLHVDFAQARDDFYEWECKQRMRAREERHRRKLEEDRLRPPSPPAIMHYSEHEAALLADKLKDDSKFSEAITVLLSWIDRGEVNRRSANQFYSMVQSANSHIRRLMNEKATHEQEMEEAKENFKNALTGILTQFEQIVAVFNASTRQKAWDHFSKAQRKNIDIWRKHSEELRNAQSEQLMGIRREEEMEMSDDENCDSPTKKMRVDESVYFLYMSAFERRKGYPTDYSLVQAWEDDHLAPRTSLGTEGRSLWTPASGPAAKGAHGPRSWSELLGDPACDLSSLCSGSGWEPGRGTRALGHAK